MKALILSMALLILNSCASGGYGPNYIMSDKVDESKKESKEAKELSHYNKSIAD